MKTSSIIVVRSASISYPELLSHVLVEAVDARIGSAISQSFNVLKACCRSNSVSFFSNSYNGDAMMENSLTKWR